MFVNKLFTPHVRFEIFDILFSWDDEDIGRFSWEDEDIGRFSNLN